MSDEPAVPEFTLPDWGTDGAPPPPAVDDESPADDTVDEIEIEVERPILLTAGSLPARWDIHTVHGLVTAHAKSEKDDPADSAASATAKAVAELREAAATMGANAVTHVSVTVGGRKSKTVVTMWGTAVSFSR
ncbi:MAG: heavy metal-binding domain-containing protein [Acidimicrobiia bacterium]|nr:heavy metal-binding domain-containing protein [Acidimicrobiia bacterium]